ncbi:unnamed protein product [Moneuplotes crassus]|uniref:Uncharacterized protein n=1 Tax=Euplotes crassus TaxID=5936 RepID=A0AAD1XWN8_EUPCR|nr:unnamed protein product [Moneuplotes crassus]
MLLYSKIPRFFQISQKKIISYLLFTPSIKSDPVWIRSCPMVKPLAISSLPNYTSSKTYS